MVYHLGLTMKLLKCRTNYRILWEKHLSILNDFIVTNDKLGYSRQKKLFFIRISEISFDIHDILI